ncbi:MAG: 4Fe-4S binding protein [Proteobacteria bacterium]|nr:4Fe-4S binding protein [Pseudomonadota bacterium]MBU4294998.1 4Fe-4S binding protein [Pseudomonadota bacterium]MCG2746650.1 4Fe-4S binding protein [Desulfobulbaceae bacterium]
MSKHSPIKTAASFIFLIVLVVGLSTVSNRIWGGKPEAAPESKELVIEPGMTVARFGQVNELPNPVLKEIFGLQDKADLQKELTAYGPTEQIASRVKGKLALAAEHGSKNWIKIPVKFGLWFVFLTSVFFLMGKRRVTPGLRNGTLLASIFLFGIALGADPSPMGTVKDAIHLYATSHVIFPPRMIALAVFLAIIFLANKYICAWGCQAGTLQDLLFRINRTDKAKAVIGRQIKLPFALTNTIRCIFLLLFTIISFSSGFDIIDPIDPFKIFKPAYLGLFGGIFVGVLLLAGLFVYRPWCHLFCPFGLAGWLMEKTSRVRISVDYETCIACGKCAAACPSTVMGAILKRDKKTIPDCFACYTCREVCPTDSIRFSTRKRTLPPTGHFEKTTNQ